MHNLRGIDCEIPLRQITVITGVSGSGKSTLAYDILYAEGQRRFVECLSAYARQFMERLERPQVEQIGHLQPPIALRQRVSIKNARSTVGSITELTDYLRLLFVHAGEAHCLACGGSVGRTNTRDAIAALQRWPAGTRLALVAPQQAHFTAAAAQRLQRIGYTRLLTGGRVREIDEWLATRPRARCQKTHSSSAGEEIGIVVDRIEVGRTRGARLAEGFQQAWSLGGGLCMVYPLDPAAAPGEALTLREGFACRDCGTALTPPSPALFSANSPLGACPDCQGFGRVITLDRDKVVPDPKKNLKNHAIVPFSVPSARSWYRGLLREARRRGIPTDVPFRDLTPAQRDWVFSGTGEFPGVEGFFEYLERKRYKMHVRIFIARFRGYVPCARCRGARLRPEALAYTIAGESIHTLHARPIEELRSFIDSLQLPGVRQRKVRTLLKSADERLRCLTDLGVGYLTLERSGRTLSGGETQRIRIAAAMGSALTDTLFILDEPTVGLHAADTGNMVNVLRRLARSGNTVVVVEHDPQVIEAADHLIVLGPGGGRDGGRLLYEGPPQTFLRESPDFFVAPLSGGAAALSARTARPHSRPRRAEQLTHPWDTDAVGSWLRRRAGQAQQTAERAVPQAAGPRILLEEAREHNLRIGRLEIPRQGLTAITGVSGSGKSTLLDAVLYRNWQRQSGRAVENVGAVARIQGLEAIAETHLIAQDPLGRSSRSNPISFVKAYTEIRALLAGTLDARRRRLGAGAFSFNVKGGRCEACRGLGTQVLEMYFLPDVEATCETCRGERFRSEILTVRWRGKNIRQILAMTVDRAARFFHREPRVLRRLAPLQDAGLGYITLGQSTATLSTGEAQRLRLAAFLAKGQSDEQHLFLFDEPTTGLHARDVGTLLRALRALIARGHGVIAVEHQLDFIAAADWIVDLGPGPGRAGGRIVHAGPLARLLDHPTSVTAQALRAHLSRRASWLQGGPGA